MKKSYFRVTFLHYFLLFHHWFLHFHTGFCSFLLDSWKFKRKFISFSNNNFINGHFYKNQFGWQKIANLTKKTPPKKNMFNFNHSLQKLNAPLFSGHKTSRNSADYKSRTNWLKKEFFRSTLTTASKSWMRHFFLKLFDTIFWPKCKRI